MPASLLHRLKRRVVRYAGTHENGYWQELSDGEIRTGTHREMVGGLWDTIGKLQLDFLIAQGLRPEHRFLDIGCGAMRGGVHFVRYLNPGNYYGVERNRSLLRAGRHELGLAGLADRDPHFLINSRFEFSQFGVEFDFAIALSVFTHLYLNHITRCLAEVHRTLAPGGAFYATYFEAPHSAHLEPITHTPGDITTHLDSDPYHYSFDELAICARHAGLNAERMTEWNHPRAQKMVRFTKA